MATAITSEAAADLVGVTQAVGSRWFRHGDGIAPIDLNAATGRYLSFAEREEIALLRVQGGGVRSIARHIGRSPSTVSRELKRNAATRCGKLEYRASVAQWKADLVARRPKRAKLVENQRLRDFVQITSQGRSVTVTARSSGQLVRHGSAATSRTEAIADGCVVGVRCR